MAPQDSIDTLGPDAGKEIIPSSGRGILLRADGDDTAGAYTVLEMASTMSYAGTASSRPPRSGGGLVRP